MDKDHGLQDRVRRFFQRVWNERDDEALADYISPDVVEHGLNDIATIPLNFDGFVQFRRQFLDAFPDAKFTVDNVMVEGERVAVRFHVHATHLGDALGFPATGRKVSFTAMRTARWRDGKIIEAWNNFDQLGLLRQLGRAD